jgi:hypothetical protein
MKIEVLALLEGVAASEDHKTGLKNRGRFLFQKR